MKKIVKIPKNRLSAPIDFAVMLADKKACGVALEYIESDRLPLGGNAVLFDAYASARKYSAFDVELGDGGYPFCLCCKTNDGSRVAYCGLRLSDEPAQKFELIASDDSLGKLTVDPDAASVPINSGVCCIADKSAYDEYVAHIKDDIHPLAGLIVLDGQTHTSVELFGKKYAVYSTGWGDGRYRCYIGYAADGKPATLLVDFGMIDYPESDGTLVDVEINADGNDVYVPDPDKSERENNVKKWTQKVKAAKTPSERLAAYARRGYAYHSSGNIDAALKDYLAAVAECKNVENRGDILRAWAVFDNAAEIYCGRSDYESAIGLMNTALDVGDDFHSGAYSRLIDMYMATKRTADAKKTAERMIAARPDDPVAAIKFAEVCVAAGDYDSAAKTYEELATRFKLFENLFDEASCLIELGKLDEADAVLERFPTKESSEQYWYYKAYIDFKNRKLSDAREKAEKSMNIDGKYMPPLYLLIDIDSLMQEYHSVARYAEEYKKIRPDHEYGYSVCAEAQLIFGNYSESSRNYMHLYDNIKKDDKYAALAAITAAATGEGKTSRAMLKALKRKHSSYYYGAVYAIYFTKYSTKDSALDKVLFKLGADDDFLLQLAVYFADTGTVIPAARILDALSKKKNPPSEVIAQQIRLSERINDQKHFSMFLEYYINNFLGVNMPYKDKFVVANRFISNKEHGSWLYGLTSLVKTPKGEKTPALEMPSQDSEQGINATDVKPISREKLEAVMNAVKKEKIGKKR